MENKQNYLGFIGIGLVILGILAFIIFSSSQSSSVEIITAEESGENQEIWVDVSGAVINPGVYRLKTGDRVKDALNAAGGLSQDADRQWVGQTINLATPLKDAIKIYIKSTKDINNGSLEVNQNISNKININTADLKQLVTLPGIGETIGQRIIDYRQENGYFTQVEDITKVSGIGQSLWEKIKDKITIY